MSDRPCGCRAQGTQTLRRPGLRASLMRSHHDQQTRRKPGRLFWNSGRELLKTVRTMGRRVMSRPPTSPRELSNTNTAAAAAAVTVIFRLLAAGGNRYVTW